MKIEMTSIAIPKQYSLPLIIALNVGILVASYFLVFGNQFKQKAALSQELTAAQQELARVSAIRNNLDKTRREHAVLAANLQEMMRQMPEEKEVPNLLRQISATAQGSRTKIKYFSPKDMEPGDFYAQLPFEIRYGANYHSLGYFFDGVRNMERIVHITSFSLENKGTTQKPLLEGSCLAKTYVFQKEGIKKDVAKDKSGKDKSKDGKKEEKNAPTKR
jgi:type IV pilus assembly protein PilO